MGNRKTGGPAFPLPHDDGTIECDDKGMSLRDYFAIHAPEPSVSDVDRELKLDRNRNPHNDPHKPRIRGYVEIIADLRYRYADAMLEAREK